MGTAEVAGQRTDVETWWRDAVVYQLYIRSFADGNGDGIGDIAGIRARLGHLRDLGVDAVWINPWYPSPMADGGYDVADYRAVEPMFGTGEEAAALVDEAHALGLRVILDIVPNHSSDQHAWFREALAAAPGSPERSRYHFRPGRGPGGDEPPNDWRSVFGGPAWSRVTDDGRPGEWYLHLFDAAQPDFNWSDPRVQEEFESILRFWFDRGVDGFRIDVAHGLVKSDGLPDLGLDEQTMLGPVERSDHPHWDRDGVHDIFRAWRRVADSYAQPRVFVGEAWVDSPERLARYLRSDELHTAFNFDFLRAPWEAPALRQAIDHSLDTVAAVGAAATWVLSNHDVVRHVSRLGRPATNGAGHSLTDLAPAPAFDRELGRRRARAAALLMFALPGGAYVYQGDELGLWEVEDLPDEVLQDPTWTRSGHTDRGRDGCRVPLPWSGTTPPFGFSPAGAHAAPWLPQPADFAAVTVEAQVDDPESMLSLYRAALALRHEHPALGDGPFTWLPSEPGVLAFARGAGFACVVNLSDGPAQLPAGARVLLGSGPDAGDGMVPPDAAVWLAV
ncbi:glycoside hydrolase family 13 protein [Pseudonocardia alaniniphila]|uniref:Glycoside hydrolase family 13 protein n=1 Tax=Pseudonocardia alaniniphila TaxID=75291 RepID=A0ABS9T7W7_9PSEU|nr:glycoside hydrolase family 13 protein [Pseudonocardia alaniniphila]MCH6164617.1 glycoside hydrolase family 13 protein [Pseudonocardia alaniniphila]